MNSKSSSQVKGKAFGLYLHIPFCAMLCHYCDFAKTARFEDSTVGNYFKQLEAHLSFWLEKLQPSLSSVFFGGGTPSLFAREYESLFAAFKPFLASKCEISLEANPDDLSIEHLQAWRDLGFNRLSIGIQSFEQTGLKFLTRSHTPQMCIEGIQKAHTYFPNLNIDLIYGWGGQNPSLWQKDLRLAAQELNVPHLSLYNLMFEPRTVIGRRAQRDLLQAPSDDSLSAFYNTACETLACFGYDHEEVSNWSKSGFSCEHNWLYWRSQYFIGVGSGAHSFFPIDGSEFGLRYAYDRTLKKFMDLRPTDAFGIKEEMQKQARTRDDWASEVVGSSLRTRTGVNLAFIKRKSDLEFRPSRIVQEAMKRGWLKLDGERLLLSEGEWFRENAWCGHVLDSLS